jgi:hypothetical protein
MANPKFVLDANVFIQAKNSYYAFDIVRGFWDSLVDFAKQDQVHSIDRVRAELERGDDELATWATTEFAFAFGSTEGVDIQSSYGEVINWVYGEEQFSEAAKSEFAGVADGWLIAYAHAKADIIVTLEILRPDIQSKVPIPNVCQALDIAYVDTFEMLRRLGVQLAQRST